MALVQLPFPAQQTPLPEIADYYRLYAAEYRDLFPEYRLSATDIWELPLWISHLDGALDRDDTVLIDASREPFRVADCVRRIARTTGPETLLFFSPLAQNLSLAAAVSRQLRARGYRTVVGGNMSELAGADDFDLVHTGLARAGIYEEIAGRTGRIGHPVTLGRRQQPLGYRPRYRLLAGLAGRVPRFRLFASHGCLFTCTFCGDAWSQQLHLVDPADLAAEVAEVRSTFPDLKIIFMGDKTFGQSRPAVENLRRVLRPEHGFRLIVQTHVAMVSPWLLDAMAELGVEVVEMGFETASSQILEELDKYGGEEVYRRAIALLAGRGFNVILNVLGGLPNETRESQAQTLAFLRANTDGVWLYNLYNFVPYPKTPIFPTLRERILDWDFANWREDLPIVYRPYHQSREEAWDHFLELVDLATTVLARRRAELRRAAG